jgi:hypothetical protein
MNLSRISIQNATIMVRANVIVPSATVFSSRLCGLVSRLNLRERGRMDRDFDCGRSQRCVVNKTGPYDSQSTGLLSLIQAGRDDLDLERYHLGRLQILFHADSHLHAIGGQFAHLQILSRIVGRARRERRQKELGGVMPSSEPPVNRPVANHPMTSGGDFELRANTSVIFPSCFPGCNRREKVTRLSARRNKREVRQRSPLRVSARTWGKRRN